MRASKVEKEPEEVVQEAIEALDELEQEFVELAVKEIIRPYLTVFGKIVQWEDPSPKGTLLNNRERAILHKLKALWETQEMTDSIKQKIVTILTNEQTVRELMTGLQARIPENDEEVIVEMDKDVAILEEQLTRRLVFIGHYFEQNLENFLQKEIDGTRDMLAEPIKDLVETVHRLTAQSEVSDEELDNLLSLVKTLTDEKLPIIPGGVVQHQVIEEVRSKLQYFFTEMLEDDPDRQEVRDPETWKLYSRFSQLIQGEVERLEYFLLGLADRDGARKLVKQAKGKEGQIKVNFFEVLGRRAVRLEAGQAKAAKAERLMELAL